MFTFEAKYYCVTRVSSALLIIYIGSEVPRSIHRNDRLPTGASRGVLELATWHHVPSTAEAWKKKNERKREHPDQVEKRSKKKEARCNQGARSAFTCEAGGVQPTREWRCHVKMHTVATSPAPLFPQHGAVPLANLRLLEHSLRAFTRDILRANEIPQNGRDLVEWQGIDCTVQVWRHLD